MKRDLLRFLRRALHLLRHAFDGKHGALTKPEQPFVQGGNYLGYTKGWYGCRCGKDWER